MNHRIQMKTFALIKTRFSRIKKGRLKPYSQVSDGLFICPILFAVISFGQDFFHIGHHGEAWVGRGALVFKRHHSQLFSAVEEGFLIDALLFQRHFDADVDRQLMAGAGEGFDAFCRCAAWQA